MINCSTILKSTNRRAKLLAFIVLLTPTMALAQFRSPEDVLIVKDVLKRFGKECPLRLSTDDEIIKRLEIESDRVRRTRISEVQKCYENNYSQVVGVFQLYRKLCEDVALKSKNLTDTQLARQLIDVSKYQAGIRTFHAVLNDCLTGLPDRKGRPFVVPLAGNELDVKALQKQIEEAYVKNPFPATVEPFR